MPLVIALMLFQFLRKKLRHSWLYHFSALWFCHLLKQSTLIWTDSWSNCTLSPFFSNFSLCLPFSFSLPYFYSLPLLLFLSAPPCFPDSHVPRADVPSWAEEAAAGAKQVSQEDIIVFIAIATRSAYASPEQSLQPLPFECPPGAPWTSPP